MPVTLKPALVLYHRDGEDKLNSLCRIEYGGPAPRLGWLGKLIDEPDLVHDFRLWVMPGEHRCRLVAELRPGTSQPAVTALISRILSVVLVTGRPLRYYTCTFLLPLDLRLDEELDKSAEDLAGACGLPTKQTKKDTLEERGIEAHRVSSKPAAVLSAAIGARVRNPNKFIEKCEEEAEAQVQIYFTPPIQRFVFDVEDNEEHKTQCALQSTDDRLASEKEKRKAIQPVKHWRLPRKKTRDWTLSLKGISLDEERIAPLEQRCAQVQDVSLYQYYNGLYLLALRVELREDVRGTATRLGLFADGDVWWQPLLTATTDEFAVIQGLQVEAWLHFTKSARLLRPAFPEEVEEGKLNQILLCKSDECLDSFTYEDDFSPVVQYLIERFRDGELWKDKKRLQHVRDDRMFVNVAYGLVGPTSGGDVEAQNAFDRLFSLALNVDRGKDGYTSQEGYAYDRVFARQQLERQAYKRWQGIGVLSGYTYWSNVFMGYGRDFNTHIAQVHVPYIYERMLMLALFYQASLYHYDRRVTAATTELIKSGNFHFQEQTEIFRKLRQDFIEFTNNYWFREITAQTQGTEIFRLQTAALALDEKYALIKDEMERADEYIEAQRQAWIGDKSNQIALAALVIAVAAMVLSLLQIGPECDKSDKDCWWRIIRSCVGLAVTLVAPVLALCVTSDRFKKQLLGRLSRLKARILRPFLLIAIAGFVLYIGYQCCGGYIPVVWDHIRDYFHLIGT